MAAPSLSLLGLPYEILDQHIVPLVGDPATRLVSRMFKTIMDSVIELEMRCISQNLFPGEDFSKNAGIVRSIYIGLIRDPYLEGAAAHLPKISHERYAELIKIQDAITFWRALPNLNLADFPRNLPPITSAEEINELLGSAIRRNPQTINLKQLWFENMEFKYLPSAIGLFTNLKRIDIANSYLRELPREIAQLPKLRSIHFYGGDNPLDSLPEGLSSSDIKMYLSPNFVKKSVQARIVYRYLQLESEQKKAVRDHIQGLPFNGTPAEYFVYTNGTLSVFDDQEKLEAALKNIDK